MNSKLRLMIGASFTLMEATGDVRELNISQLAAGIYHLYADGEY